MGRRHHRLVRVAAVAALVLAGLAGAARLPARAGTPGEVWNGDFPDPFVLRVGPVYFAYATENQLTEVQTIESTDLVHWSWVGDAMGRLPDWASWGYLWGPSVLARTGSYVLYYATREAATGTECISHAVSALPSGPFVDTSTGPLVCQRDRGGSIDPSPFVDADGRAYLVWKSEGTATGEPTRIWSQGLTPDGLGLVGEPTELLHTDQPWEGPIVEAPSMTRTADGYHLLYSGNRWETADYAVGHATCASPAGPCTKTGAPVLASRGSLAGPGSAEVFTDATGGLHLAFHAWDAGQVGYPGGARSLHVAPLMLAGTSAVVGG